MKTGRVLAAIAGLGMLATGSAYAGDTASLDVIGYSQDGRIFAFEEHGVTDGAGFAYSHYFFIDTVEDKYLPGTPIRVQVDEETSVKKIREMARAKAKPLIDKYALDDSPGAMLAYNPTSEYDSNPHSLRYFGNLSNPPRLKSYTLTLTEKEFPAPEECANMIGVYTGFSLSYTEQDGEPANKLLYADKSVPKSRNCPNSYRIGAVIGNSEIVAPQIAMVLVASYGFEGNDERWLAIPLNPDKPTP